jgi:hypothetical protein
LADPAVLRLENLLGVAALLPACQRLRNVD